MATVEYYLQNKAQRIAYQKKYYSENSELIKLKNSEYNKKNYQKHLKEKQDYQKKHWNNIKIRTMTAIGELLCSKCGYDDIRALHIDHLNGNGTQHRKSFTSNKKFMAYVEMNPKEFQILCANCNYIKRYENKEFRKSKYEL